MQSVRKDEIMLSELDQKRIDHLHKLLKKEEKTNQDAAAALRWAILALNSMIDNRAAQTKSSNSQSNQKLKSTVSWILAPLTKSSRATW